MRAIVSHDTAPRPTKRPTNFAVSRIVTVSFPADCNLSNAPCSVVMSTMTKMMLGSE